MMNKRGPSETFLDFFGQKLRKHSKYLMKAIFKVIHVHDKDD